MLTMPGFEPMIVDMLGLHYAFKFKVNNFPCAKSTCSHQKDIGSDLIVFGEGQGINRNLIETKK